MRPTRRHNRTGQTFSLIHLIELLLAIVVLATISFGAVRIISGVNFFEEYYAKDNAHLVETLYALPNGNAEFGYLWTTKNYQYELAPGLVTVQRIQQQQTGLLRFVQGAPYKKQFGTSEQTTITPAIVEPKYLRYTALGTPQQTITVSSQLAARGCTQEPVIQGMQLGTYSATDSVGRQVATQSLEQAHSAGLGTVGPSLIVLYQASPSLELVLIDRTRTVLTSRITCLLEQELTSRAVTPAQSSIAAEAQAVQAQNGDIILIVRGRPQDVELVQRALGEALTALTAPSTQATPEATP
jgi:hypothetical protein